MPFALDASPTPDEMAEAINYLLANNIGNVSADPNTGQITGPQGVVVAYLYRYLSVKYADSFDGSLNFSNSQVGRLYYGVWNNNSSTESTNPADYIWYKVAGGFGSTKTLFYETTGGRAINFVVSTVSPGNSYLPEPGTAIDLDVITASVKANSATTAYLVQSQSAAAPSGFPLYTSGSSLPAGWSANLGTVSVGQVAWYSFGRYNGSTVTVDGIPPNSTYWSVPVAASIFQDIRSDNWNGSTPPIYGTPSTYGTAGYYIQRDTGDVYFNDGVFRADIQTDGDGQFFGRNPTSITINVPGSSTTYSIDYSLYGLASGTVSGTNIARTGVFGYAYSANPSGWNVGVAGIAATSSNNLGSYGQGYIGGFFETNAVSGIGLVAEAFSSSGTAIQISQGKFTWAGYSYSQPPGSGVQFMRDDGTWATLQSTAPGSAYYLSGSGWSSTNPILTTGTGNSGSATASSNNINFVGSLSTGIAGAYVGVTGSGNTLTWTVQATSPSDVRLKEEIADIDVGLAFVKQLRPVSYKLKADPKHQKGYGFIAQEVEQLVGNETSLVYFEPDWQVGEEKGFNTIHYPSYIAVLTKAIQELTAKVEALESQLQSPK